MAGASSCLLSIRGALAPLEGRRARGEALTGTPNRPLASRGRPGLGRSVAGEPAPGEASVAGARAEGRGESRRAGAARQPRLASEIGMATPGDKIEYSRPIGNALGHRFTWLPLG